MSKKKKKRVNYSDINRRLQELDGEVYLRQKNIEEETKKDITELNLETEELRILKQRNKDLAENLTKLSKRLNKSNK